MKPFWPDGEKVAEGLRKATKGVQAANKEMEVMKKNLPDLQKGPGREPQVGRADTRHAGRGPQASSRKRRNCSSPCPSRRRLWPRRCPKWARTLSQTLRETKKLRRTRDRPQGRAENAGRHTQDLARCRHGPEEICRRFARGAKTQLDEATANRVDYEHAMESSSRVARSLAEFCRRSPTNSIAGSVSRKRRWNRWRRD